LNKVQRRRRAQRRHAQALKTRTAGPVVVAGSYGADMMPDETDCPDRDNHLVCPVGGGEHDWMKPHPRPADHKYECDACGHYDLDDYM